MSSSLVIEPFTPRVPFTLDTLPLDILYRIISFTSVLDIIRFRQISRFFRELMQTDTIWRNAYRTTSLPRYPGPFPHQSAAFLRDTLVRSARVAQNWAPNVPVPTSQRTFEDNKHYSRRRFFMNRWLMGIDSDHKHSINCIDLDTASGVVTPSIIYRSDEGRFIHSHWYLSTTSLEGHTLAFAVVLETGPCAIENALPNWQVFKLFKFIGNNGTTPMFEFVQSYLTNWDGPGLAPKCFIGPRLLVIAGDLRDIDGKTLYIDLETFKPCDVSLPPAEMAYCTTFISCVKHLLVIRSPIPLVAADGHVIPPITLDALAIPPLGTGFRSDLLKLSHRGHHPGVLTHAYLLHDPVANPWLREPHILLYAVVHDLVPGLPYSIDRIKVVLSDDNCSIMCEAQTITKSDFDHYLPPVFSMDGMTGSSRSVNIQGMAQGPQLRACALTLRNNSDLYEGSQGVRNDLKLHRFDRALGVDRVTGRVVLHIRSSLGRRVFRVLEFA
ncbi:hypothetical protein BJ138DRAFT_1143622 [Hygrophoropsis aurantiaca]|uniref:Uncharacterized protein n=1 Tax=Hygrophoropsis aurantiaca TaxID=72124 RepID=A0ACB8AMM7_9AGAM|nr:hypothetical protein BJ138DRAFT_1143622 [Hygrophoropsis aurantiaca]